MNLRLMRWEGEFRLVGKNEVSPTQQRALSLTPSLFDMLSPQKLYFSHFDISAPHHPLFPS